MPDFFVIPTNIGEAKMANALALGVPLAITDLAVGDGEGDGARGTPTPDPEAAALVSERRRAPVNSFAVDPNNANVLIAEQVIPETEGGWWIREMGLFDEDGDLIFVCNTPPTYKPQLSEGSGRTQVVRMASIVSDTAAVTLKVDPSVVLATREYVDESVDGLSSEVYVDQKTEGLATTEYVDEAVSGLVTEHPIDAQKVSQRDNFALFRKPGEVSLDAYKHPDPILTAGSSGWDADFVADPFPIAVNGVMYLFYEGYDGIRGKIGVASSNDGINFTKHANNPIVDPLDVGDAHYSFPQVHRYGDTFYMHLSGTDDVSDTGKFLKLYKTDIANFPEGWTEVKTTVSRGEAGDFDESNVSDGILMRVAGGWVIVYSGKDATGADSLGAAYSSSLSLEFSTFVKATEVSPFPKSSSGFGSGYLKCGGSAHIDPSGEIVFFFQANDPADSTYDFAVGLAAIAIPHLGKAPWVRVMGANIDGSGVVQPILGVGPTGSWDDNGVHHLAFEWFNGKWLGYYDGSQADNSWKIGLVEYS